MSRFQVHRHDELCSKNDSLERWWRQSAAELRDAQHRLRWSEHSVQDMRWNVCQSHQDVRLQQGDKLPDRRKRDLWFLG